MWRLSAQPLDLPGRVACPPLAAVELAEESRPGLIGDVGEAEDRNLPAGLEARAERDPGPRRGRVLGVDGRGRRAGRRVVARVERDAVEAGGGVVADARLQAAAGELGRRAAGDRGAVAAGVVEDLDRGRPRGAAGQHRSVVVGASAGNGAELWRSRRHPSTASSPTTAAPSGIGWRHLLVGDRAGRAGRRDAFVECGRVEVGGRVVRHRHLDPGAGKVRVRAGAHRRAGAGRVCVDAHRGARIGAADHVGVVVIRRPNRADSGDRGRIGWVRLCVCQAGRPGAEQMDCRGHLDRSGSRRRSWSSRAQR